MARSNPVIGIPANLLVDKSGDFQAMVRAYMNQDYLDSVQMAGGVPVILPVLEPDAVQAQLDLVDGLLFAGGADLSPLSYGEEPIPELGDTFQEMDRHQIALARSARALGMPMLGICRGLQLLNVAFGGTLHQDLNSRPGSCLQHVQHTWRQVGSHYADLEPDSRLASICGSAPLLVNSFHHQAMKDLAPGFRINARARDGVVEGIEAPDQGFLLAVQWHPEGMVPKHAEMLRLFQALVEACGRPTLAC